MDTHRSTIVVLSEDLLIVPPFEDTGRRLGFNVTVIDSPKAIDAEGPSEPRRILLTEPLSGADGRFLREIVNLQPALLFVDTRAKQIPWARWIHTLKTSAATRRIPVVAFGPHVETSDLARARAAGAEAVMAHGGLVRSLAQVIQKWARTVDVEALLEACGGELSESAQRGVELIHQGSYYEAHEALEQAWKEADELEGHLYRSLLQVAVAYHHIRLGNYAGARKMLLRLRQWIGPLPDACRGVDIRALKLQLDTLDDELESAGPEGMALVKRSLLQPIPGSKG